MRIITFFIASILIFSCSTKGNQSEIDDQIIRDYLASKQLHPIKDTSGLYYITTVEGTGTAPTINSTIEVKYIGSLINGSIFDQTLTDKTFSYALSGLIKGWQIGIPLMKTGGKATFYIPSALGYGATGWGIIPPNAVLVFEIELISVK
jgi:FKBP-type peptidyl-prolyl cis-trans isomerase